MARRNKRWSIRGWLLVYIIGSIPVLLFYSAGLSGWFFDYPLSLFAAIFAVFSIPLVLILFKHPSAPRWNIILLWTVFVLITLRIIYGILFSAAVEGRDPASNEELLGAMPTFLGVVAFSLLWAAVWTRYFRKLVIRK